MRRPARITALVPTALVIAAASAACYHVPGRTAENLDGLYLTAGPVGAAVRAEGEWASAVGLEASLVRVREHATPAALGLAAGGVTYAGRDGGRVWLEAEAAVKGPLPVAVGLGLGATAEVEGARVQRAGGQATLWVFAGLIPYLRFGAMADAGTFVEAGAMLKLPLPRLAD